MQNHIFINTTERVVSATILVSFKYYMYSTANSMKVFEYLRWRNFMYICCVCYVKYLEIRKSPQSNNDKISIIRIKYEQ